MKYDMEDLCHSARVHRRENVQFGIDGTVYIVMDKHNFREIFHLSDVEESPDVRVVRVRIMRPEFEIWPPCPSSSWKVSDNPFEINMRIECHEEMSLFGILHMVIDGKRVLDHLETKLDLWTHTHSMLAYRVDIMFSGRKPIGDEA